MASDKANVLLLFDRPTEPVFMNKGVNNTVFDVPNSFLIEKYQTIGPQLASRFEDESTNKIQLQNISLPDLAIPLQLDRKERFSVFIPKHRRVADRMIDILKNCKLEDLVSTAAYARDRVNPHMFHYALSVALLHRGDTADLPLPNFAEAFPAKFIDSTAFSSAREEAIVVPRQSRSPIVISRDYTGSDIDPEHRVAYFREDIGINLHHWHWHLVYPNNQDMAIVAKDRRGELFYYMHQQALARYNFERLSNNLFRVKAFRNLKELIPEGYFPKLDSIVSNRAWPPRFANITLSNVNRTGEELRINIDDLNTWRDRIINAIDEGVVVNTAGQRVQLTEVNGIDILGNIVESSILSINQNFYGDIHNMGHALIAFCHDPENKYLESFAVMGDTATAMRDPIFYRWHANMDDIFQRHKTTLPPYIPAALEFPNITINGVSVEVTGGGTNIFETFWQQSDLDLSRGLDFSPRGSIFVRFSHLQHRPYSYRIRVTNSNASSQVGTVRIFMGPRTFENGAPLTFNEQRLAMIELDKFRVNLNPGRNLIIRTSAESSVTIPYERTFRSLENRPTGGAALSQFNFCGCGWPQHMLIPKGNAQNLQADLFVMISNFVNDRIDQDVSGVCNDADSYCGILNNRYPDRRSMGYPFDRVGRQGATTLARFLTPNMAVQRVAVHFTDRTEVRNQNSAQ